MSASTSVSQSIVLRGRACSGKLRPAHLLLLLLFFCCCSLPLSALRCSSSFLKRTIGTGSGLFASKFDPNTFISVSVARPLGISLEEVQENAARGVIVTEVQKEGNAKATSKVNSGLFLVKANGIDVKYKTFDEIMDIFGATPSGEKVDLVFVDPNNVFKGPAEILVKQAGGPPLTIKALKGQNLRNVLLDAKVAVYGERAKFTNCGGGMSCGTCVVDVSDNLDWEKRPDIETRRLGKKYADSARLSCNTIIEGDCTVKIQPPKAVA